LSVDSHTSTSGNPPSEVQAEAIPQIWMLK